MIVERDGKFCVQAHESGENMGCYDTKEEAETRLKEIESHAAEMPKPESMVKEKDSEIQYAKKPIAMPILPSKPQKTVDGREVTQELIDGMLAYDAEKRTAIVALNREDAHGEGNQPVIGKVSKVYEKNDVIVADVLPVRGFEEVLPTLASEAYPDRSIEADWLNLDGNDSKRLYLEAIKLCGSQRPALNLPPVTFTTTSAGKQIFKFTTTTGGAFMPKESTEKQEPESKESEKKEEPRYTMVVPIEKELANIKAEFAKRDSEKEERIADLEAKLLDKDLDHWVKSPKMLRKIPPFQRANAVNIIKAAMERKETTTFHFAKEIQEVPIGEAIKNLLEGLPDTLIATRPIADEYPNQFPDVAVDKKEKELIAVAKIRQYAKTHNINLATPDGYTKAESAVKSENPDLWEVV